MKAVGAVFSGALGLATLAHAADLPTTKAPAAASPPNCFASFWTWLDTSAAACPISAMGVTVYGTLDLGGLAYMTNGASYNAPYPGSGLQSLISRQNNGPKWVWSPNNISTTVLGAKISEPIAAGWSLIGAVEAGFDPYSGTLLSGQSSLVMNNGKAVVIQSSNGDSSRAGQWDNSQAFLGVSNTTYGTLTWGRVNALSLDILSAYDPLGAPNAFDPLGFFGSYAGFGNTEATRSNTALTYRLAIANFRAAALVQTGGYNLGNGSTAMVQGQVGADLGRLSLDAVAGFVENAVGAGIFSGSCSSTACSSAIPQYYNASDLKATLSNNTGLIVAAKYKLSDAVTFYGGYEVYRQANPSDDYLNGFKTIGGYNIPATIPSWIPGAPKYWPTQWTNYTAYDNNKLFNFFWTGIKYAFNSQLDVMGGVYYGFQNDYYTGVCTGTGVNTKSGSCAGSTDSFSLLIDYRPYKRMDLYFGVALSNVYGGMASGYLQTQNIDPTVGLRIKF